MRSESIFIDAKSLYNKGNVKNLRYDKGKSGIVLYNSRVIEDDSPGFGYPYGKEILKSNVQIKKELYIKNPEAFEAWLLIYDVPMRPWRAKVYDAPAIVSVNGNKIKTVFKYGWNKLRINTRWLKKGKNEIVIYGLDKNLPPIIPVAEKRDILKNYPGYKNVKQRSLRSKNNGKTWSALIGMDGKTKGEYFVRMHLKQHLSFGEYLTPVVDMGDSKEKQIIKQIVKVDSFVFNAKLNLTAGTKADLFCRTSNEPFSKGNVWKKCKTGSKQKATGRYLQGKIILRADNPLKTPVLKGIEIKSQIKYRRSDIGVYKIKKYDNHKIIRTSLSFEHEDFNNASLRKLRRLYKLDEVVKNCKTQFEKIVALNYWVANQWKWHPPVKYPDWNALQILEKQKNGKPLGGFCGHFAIVMVQCCLALGITARFIFSKLEGVIFGHEVTEVWSDEYDKWIMMDPNINRYFRDRKTNIPLSALELHEQLLDFYFKNEKQRSNEFNKKKVDAIPLKKFLKEGPIVCDLGPVYIPGWFNPDRSHLMWGSPRMMPRSNFFSKKYPIPKAHGYGTCWSWNEYYLWQDERTPRGDSQFDKYVERERDWYWSINRVQFIVEQTNKENVLRVYLDTFTPGLKNIMVKIDDWVWKPAKKEFLWKLHYGKNGLRAKTVNVMGVEGKESAIEILI